MEIKYEKRGMLDVFHLDGALDTNTSSQLETALEEKCSQARQVVIDLKNVRYISSAGLRVILSAHKKLSAKGATLTIENPSPLALELFEMTGFSKFLNVKE